MRGTRHRPVEQQLVEGQFALEDIALGEADLVLEFARRPDFGMQDEVLEARRIVVDLVDDRLAESVALGVGPFARLRSWAGNIARRRS